MSSSSWTQADLDALEAAIAKGVRRVKYSDKEIWYHSLDEMLKLRDTMRKCLGKAAKTVRVYASHDKGLC